MSLEEKMKVLSEVESGKSASEVCKPLKSERLNIEKAVAREPPYNMARVYRYRCHGTLYPGIFYSPG